VVLAAFADQTPRQRAVLQRVTDLTSYVAAEESEAAGFDAYGGLVPDYWDQRPIGLPCESLRVVERLADEPAAIAKAVADAAEQLGGNVSEPEVIIAMADEKAGPAIARGLRAAGASARTAVGRAFSETAPAMLLEGLARLRRTNRLDAFAAVIRHPDLEAWLQTQHTPPDDGWATLLDRWATRTLRGGSLRDWLDTSANDPDASRDFNDAQRTQAEHLRAAYRSLDQLLPASDTDRRPLPQWSDPIRSILEQVYGPRELKSETARDAETVQALIAIADALDEQEQLTEPATEDLVLDVASALRWTLARGDELRLRDPPSAGDIEAMGLLDAALDSARICVVASANDGHLPRPLTDPGDGLLPDSLRTQLGLPDNAQRRARDAYLLNTLHRRAGILTLVASRRGNDDEPRRPSRLWVRGADPADTAWRLLAFYGESDDIRLDADAPTPWTHGSRNAFIIPRPDARLALPDPLSVTALRDYLQCPYRFYLTHVQRLRPIDDEAVEMDAAVFGSLLHDVLADFSQMPPDEAGSLESDVVAGQLLRYLQRRARRLFGRDPRAAVRVQLAFAQERLTAFADLQARWNRDGWKILHVEEDLQACYPVEAGSVAVRGRIDRIDFHPDGRIRVIDFKTGDTAVDPLRQHLRNVQGQPRWHDLQLPMYRDLLRRHREPLDLPDGEPEFGYVVLPRKLDEIGWRPLEADADFWLEAHSCRDEVFSGILSRDFRPTLDPPTYTDALTPVAAETWPGRRADIADWHELPAGEPADA
jgi:hypothetical protein